MRYFVTPNCNIQVIAKNITTTLAKVIVETFYSDALQAKLATLLAGDTLSEFDYKALVPTSESPDGNKVALIREPVDRFLSACAMNNTDVQEAIDNLTNGIGWQAESPIFEKQTCDVDTKPYAFPAQLETFCIDMGLLYPLPVLNEGVNPKPVLTKAQQSWVNNYYADDIKLFAGL